MTLDEFLSQIEARANAASNLRSDDFGHDTQALLVAESDKLHEIAGTDVHTLLAMLRLAIEHTEGAITNAYFMIGKEYLAKEQVEKFRAELLKLAGGDASEGGVIMDQPSKLSEYAFALEQDQKAQEVKVFLRQVLGGYEYEQNKTVAFIDGYHAAMKRIIQQAEL